MEEAAPPLARGSLSPRSWILLGALAQLVLVLGVLLVATGGGSFLPGLPTRDLFDHLWLHDWLGGQLLQGGDLLGTTQISWPEGGAVVHPDPLGLLLYLPLSLVLGGFWPYIGLLVLQLWLACLAAWPLGARLSGSRLAGWFAGLAFGLSAFSLGQACGGETETVAAWPLALGLYFLERAAERGRWRDAVLGGALGALAAVGCWYYGAFFSLYLVAWALLRCRRLVALGALAGFAALVVAPAWIYASVLAGGENLFQGPDMATYLAQHSATLPSLVGDPAGWLGFFPELAVQAGFPRVQYLGSLTLLLALVGLAGGRGAGRLWWGGVALVALALSLGPVLHFGGEPLTVGGRALPGPYRLLVGLPYLGLMRIPHRWTLLAALALAMLAGRGLSFLAGDAERAWGAARLPVLVALATLLLLMDLLLFAHAPLQAARSLSAELAEPPAVYGQLEGAGAVLDLPPRVLGDDARGRYLVWQRQHGRPVPYSLLMTALSPSLANEPLVAVVAAMDRRDPISQRPEDAAQFRRADLALLARQFRSGERGEPELAGAAERLRALGIEAVVLHSGLLHPEDAGEAARVLQDQLGTPALELDGCLAWELDAAEVRP